MEQSQHLRFHTEDSVKLEGFATLCTVCSLWLQVEPLFYFHVSNHRSLRDESEDIVFHL